MAQNKSLLQQRAEERVRLRENRKAELQRLRDTDVGEYIQTVSANAVPRTVGATNRVTASKAKAEKKSDREPSRLMKEMAAMTAKMNGDSRQEKSKERETAAREAREKDIQNKREEKRQVENNRNFSMLSGVFKDQTDKLLKALNGLGKKNGQGPAQAEEDSPSLMDLIEQYEKGKEEEKKSDENESDGDRKKKKRKKKGKKANRRSRNQRRRSRRNRRALGGVPTAGDEFDLDDDADEIVDIPDTDRQSRRDDTRRRRMDRLRNRRSPAGRGFGRLRTKASGAIDAVRGSGAYGKLATGVKVLGGLGAVASAADALYNAAPKIGDVFDSEKDTSDRVAAGAHLAIQGAGAGIGGILGGPQGAAFGAMIGDKVADAAKDMGESIASNIDIYGALHDEDGIVNQTKKSLKSMMETLTGSDVGKALGVAAAVAMSPFSEDARKALKHDWEQKILPAFDNRFDDILNGMSNYTGALKLAGANIFDGLKKAGGDITDGLSEAGDQIADAYKKKGIVGALQAVPGTATKVFNGFGRAYDSAKDGVASAGSAIRYGMQKGTSNELDLALGFSAKKGIKGFNDSQTKAYAGNVIKTESGGKIDIVNSKGFSGQYQFGADALADQGIIDKDRLKAAKKAAGENWYKQNLHTKFMEDESNWKNQGGRREFLSNKTLQDETFVTYTNRNIEAGYRSGALTAKSTPEQIAAYAKAAHLKGVGGANDYFLRGIDSADANGTRVSSYAQGAASSMMSLAGRVDGAKAKGVLADPKVKTDLLAKATPTSSTKTAGATPVNAKALTKDSKDLKTQMAEVNPPKATSIGTSPSKAPNATGATHAAVAVTTVASNASTPTATAVAQPVQTVSRGTPEEVKTVNVANAPQQAPSNNQTVIAGGGGGRQTSQPTLDEIPMYINDMGLVLLNIGHV